MNKTIIGTRVFQQFLDNLTAYFEGREYWDKVDWELLSGSSPYPTYGVENLDPLVFG